jgi:predicted SAM-dependent methyltransferase
MYWRLERFNKAALHILSMQADYVRTYLWRIREKKLPKTADGKVLFHIGCGDINAPEFINIDARKAKHIHIVTRNIFRLWMIPANTADLIYMCHILEHVPRSKLSLVLKEMSRILKPNGILRLSVPDFDYIISIYNDTNHNIKYISQPLMGGQDYPENFHFEVFNKQYLEKLLIDNGFKDVMAWYPTEVDHHNFQDWASTAVTFDNKEYLISLNLEAAKSS